jgi:hypothetical protein
MMLQDAPERQKKVRQTECRTFSFISPAQENMQACYGKSGNAGSNAQSNFRDLLSAL